MAKTIGLKEMLDLNFPEGLSDEIIFWRTLVLLHEIGHLKMIKMLHIPHDPVAFNMHIIDHMDQRGSERPAFIDFCPRNRLNRLLVALAGIVYPALYMLLNLHKVPHDLKWHGFFLFKCYSRLAFHGILHIREEMGSPIKTT